MKNNQRIALTKRLLQESLLRIMKEKPLDKIRITELYSEAGINRATFYRHYNVPRDVLTEMQAQFAEEIQASLDLQALIDAPFRYVEQLCTHLYENSELVKLFIRNNSEEEIICLFDEFFLVLFSKNKTFNKERSLDQSEIKLISAYMAGGGYYMLRRWLMDDIEKTPKEISQLVYSFLKEQSSFVVS